MNPHDLHTISTDVTNQLKLENPDLEFRPEVNGTELSLFVMHPDGVESRYHLDVTEKDDVIPQPVFRSAIEGNNAAGEMSDKTLNDKWVSLLKERIQKTGFDYSFDEIGGEG